jgi:hypothetical protein
MAEKKKEYISFSDMFDGGGAGQSGPEFEGGGIISAIGNSLGGPKIFGGAFASGDDAPGGGTRIKHEQPVGIFTDAFDGGGFGYSGDYFEGGPYSMIANILGINPMGSENLAQTVAQNPQPQPQMPFATVTQPGETGDPLAAVNNPSVYENMPAPNNTGIPTFSEFTEGPGIKFLNVRTQMQMYDALYGRSQPAPSYFTGMDASGGMRV